MDAPSNTSHMTLLDTKEYKQTAENGHVLFLCVEFQPKWHQYCWCRFLGRENRAFTHFNEAEI